MRWISRDEKEILKEWASAVYSDELRTNIMSMEESDSYWNLSNNSDNIEEYSFDRVPELKEMLKDNFDEEYMTDILMPCIVATFKERAKIKMEKSERGSENVDEDFKIPEYIYVF